MRIRVALLSLLLPLFMGRSPSPHTQPVSVTRSYNGAASVGDFFTLTVDPVAYTLTYTDWSNGDSGTIYYQVNGDGTYQLNDPNRNLVAAYEVPNYALLIQATNTGPDHDAPALVVAMQDASISVPKWGGRNYNYLQFGAGSGGFEVGSIATDAQGDVTTTAYWPLGALSQEARTFHRSGFSGRSLQEDASGSFLRLPDNDGGSRYIFGTDSETLAMDTANGAILGFRKANGKNFDPSFAGDYKGLYYQKTGARQGSNNFETGTPSFGDATMVVGPGGHVAMKDAAGNTLLQTTLTPLADAAYVYGTDKLQDPCFGLFTFRVSTANSQTDIFVGFMNRGVLMSSFNATLPWKPGGTYDYLYAVGLR